MKKVLFLVALMVATVQVSARNDREAHGFTVVMDITGGYHTSCGGGVLNTAMMFGCQFDNGLFLGSGPTLGAGYNPSTEESLLPLGVSTKLRWTAMCIKSKVRPFIEGRAGYAVDLDEGFNMPNIGLGMGISIANRLRIAFYNEIVWCQIGESRKRWNGYYYSYYDYTTSELEYAPSIAISIDF